MGKGEGHQLLNGISISEAVKVWMPVAGIQKMETDLFAHASGSFSTFACLLRNTGCSIIVLIQLESHYDLMSSAPVFPHCIGSVVMWSSTGLAVILIFTKWIHITLIVLAN